MYKRVLSIFIAMGFMVFLYAQPSNDTGISVHKNSRIDLILKKQSTGTITASSALHKQTHVTTGYKVKRQGYRIMVLNTNDRVLAYKTKGQLLSHYPDQQVYMSYQAPFFKLKIGDFVSKSDAEDLRKELTQTMPKGVFLIRESVIVTVKPDEEAKM